MIKRYKSVLAVGLAICLMVQMIFGAAGETVTPLPSEPATINNQEKPASNNPSVSEDNTSLDLDDASVQYSAIVPWLELAAKAVLLTVPFDQLVGALQQPLISVDGCLMLLDIAKNNVLLVQPNNSDSQSNTDNPDLSDDGALDNEMVINKNNTIQLREARVGYQSVKSGVIYSSNLPYRVYWLYLNRGNDGSPEWLFVLMNSQGQVVRMAARTGDGRIVPASLASQVTKQTSSQTSNQTSIKATTASLGLDFLERYVAYRVKNGAMAQKDVIRAVQLNMDRGFYERVQVISGAEAGALLVLVNKFYRLPKEYAPAELVTVDTRYARNGWRYELRADAYGAFVKMRKAAEAEGLRLVVASAYRSYGTQGNVYADYVAGSGKAAAEQYSARPGHSEHQTGLAMDIRSGSSEGSFVGSREFKWLVANGHRFGFVLRYPKGKTAITGYAYEPWHWRYVGVEAAKAMKASGLTLEEYLIYK